MNRQQATALLPLIKAFAEGKTIEWRCRSHIEDDDQWTVVNNPSWDPDTFEFRLQPRTWWLNIYEVGNNKYEVAYGSRELADRAAHHDRRECVKVQEVI